MRRNIIVAVGIIIIVILATFIKIYGAEKIYIHEIFKYGGVVSAPESLHYAVYGNGAIIDADKALEMTDADTIYYDSVSGNYAGYENLQLRIYVYDDSTGCSPCETWQWVRQTQTFYNIGPASGDSTTFMYAIARNPISAEQQGAYIEAKFQGNRIEDTCNNTLMIPYTIRSAPAGSDGVVSLELVQSSCLAGAGRCIIWLIYGSTRKMIFNDTIPSDQDSVLITNY